MNNRKWTNEELRKAVKESISFRQSLQKLNLQASGGNYSIIRGWIKKLNIDTSHFLGAGYLKGKNHNWAKKRDLKDVLTENSNYQSFKLKNRLIKEKIFQEVCSSCNKTEWESRTTGWKKVKIPLELEHKNGVSTDNRLENLELLCPICHAFTETYGGKNKKVRWVSG